MVKIPSPGPWSVEKTEAPSSLFVVWEVPVGRDQTLKYCKRSFYLCEGGGEGSLRKGSSLR